MKQQLVNGLTVITSFKIDGSDNNTVLISGRLPFNDPSSAVKLIISLRFANNRSKIERGFSFYLASGKNASNHKRKFFCYILTTVIHREFVTLHPLQTSSRSFIIGRGENK
jgi:hypothetical protein